MKCEICRQKIEQTFLNKLHGTFVKDAKGKKHLICKECQKKEANDKSRLLQNVPS
jgi:hypothetical protein